MNKFMRVLLVGPLLPIGFLGAGLWYGFNAWQDAVIKVFPHRVKNSVQ